MVLEKRITGVAAVLAMTVSNFAETYRYMGTILQKIKESGDYIDQSSGERQ